MIKALSPTFLTLLGLITLVPSVAAHGYLSQVTIDGTPYQGNVPNNDAFASPIRLIDDVSPVKGADNPFLSCGQNAAVAQTVASANPGSAVSFSWASGTGGTWPHNIGPLMTYMASCSGTTCDKFDASNAQWFKIDQVGKEQGSDTWVQQNFFEGKPYNLTLPTNIEPGDYLIRHEIIALHVATTLGGAEFYPSCTQVRIGGSGSGVPSSTVSFPGAYQDTDPGIFDPDVFNPGSNYTSFPGPPLSNLVAGGTDSAPPTQGSPAASSDPAPSASAPASSAPVQSPAATTAPSAGTCNKKRMLKRRAKRSSSWF